MTGERKIIAWNAGGRRVRDIDVKDHTKILDFIKTLTGSDLGAFFIYEEGFLASDVHIPERLQIE